MIAEETTLIRLKMGLSDEDESEGADPLVLDEEEEETEADDFEELVEDDEEEEVVEEVGFGSDEEGGGDKVSLEELRERELDN